MKERELNRVQARKFHNIELEDVSMSETLAIAAFRSRQQVQFFESLLAVSYTHLAITSANPAASLDNVQRQVEGATQNYTAETIRMEMCIRDRGRPLR